MNDAAHPMTGKTVLVTGSTDGIGRETAERLSALGAEVLVANGVDGKRGCRDVWVGVTEGVQGLDERREGRIGMFVHH